MASDQPLTTNEPGLGHARGRLDSAKKSPMLVRGRIGGERVGGSLGGLILLILIILLLTGRL